MTTTQIETARAQIYVVQDAAGRYCPGRFKTAEEAAETYPEGRVRTWGEARAERGR